MPLKLWAVLSSATLLDNNVSLSVPLLMLLALKLVSADPSPLKLWADIAPSTLSPATAVPSLLVMLSSVSAVSFSSMAVVPLAVLRTVASFKIKMSLPESSCKLLPAPVEMVRPPLAVRLLPTPIMSPALVIPLLFTSKPPPVRLTPPSIDAPPLDTCKLPLNIELPVIFTPPVVTVRPLPTIRPSPTVSPFATDTAPALLTDSLVSPLVMTLSPKLSVVPSTAVCEKLLPFWVKSRLTTSVVAVATT